MQTVLTELLRDTPEGQQAQAILRACVHCGFCSATCPTYQVTGNELDSPRGRIYLIKQMLEGAPVSTDTRDHIDSCLTCRSCETTCPSGVRYGHLVDIGRKVLSERVPRGRRERFKRSVLTGVLGSPMVGVLIRAGQWLRPAVPRRWKHYLAARRPAGDLPTAQHSRRVWLLAGCVQPGMLPSIDAATMRVLDRLGISSGTAQNAGCCGALRFHLDEQDAALQQMRRNIDAWWPDLAAGRVEALVMNASGCGAMVREYGHHLRHDPVYAEKAAQVSAMVKDIAEVLAPHAAQLKRAMRRPIPRAAFHPPCTLQHWQGLRQCTETLLAELGFELVPFADSHLCCGSAGAYSMLQPAMADTLRERKLDALGKTGADLIVSANIGCLNHLQAGTQVPVRHWVEALDEALA